jgi:hypothetical protein
MDPLIVRVVFVVLTVVPPGVGFFLYLALWFLMPRSDEPAAASSSPVTSRFSAMGDDLRRMGEDIRTGVRSGFRRTSSTPEGAPPPTDAPAPPT